MYTMSGIMTLPMRMAPRTQSFNMCCCFASTILMQLLQLATYLKRQGLFVVAALTRPFEFEGRRKLEEADALIEALDDIAQLVVSRQHLEGHREEQSAQLCVCSIMAWTRQGVCRSCTYSSRFAIKCSKGNEAMTSFCMARGPTNALPCFARSFARVQPQCA